MNTELSAAAAHQAVLVPVTLLPLSLVWVSLVPLSLVWVSAVPLLPVPVSLVPTSLVPLSLVAVSLLPLVVTLVPLVLVSVSLVPWSLVPVSLVPLLIEPMSLVWVSLVPLSLVWLSTVPLSLVALSLVPTSPVALSLVPTSPMALSLLAVLVPMVPVAVVVPVVPVPVAWRLAIRRIRRGHAIGHVAEPGRNRTAQRDRGGRNHHRDENSEEGVLDHRAAFLVTAEATTERADELHSESLDVPHADSFVSSARITAVDSTRAMPVESDISDSTDAPRQDKITQPNSWRLRTAKCVLSSIRPTRTSVRRGTPDWVPRTQHAETGLRRRTVSVTWGGDAVRHVVELSGDRPAERDRSYGHDHRDENGQQRVLDHCGAVLFTNERANDVPEVLHDLSLRKKGQTIRSRRSAPRCAVRAGAATNTR